MQALSAGAPNRSDYRFLLSAAAGKTGDVLVAQGDLAGALAASRDSLGLIKMLTQLDPGNGEWQAVLSNDEDRVGDVLAAQGDLAGATRDLSRQSRDPSSGNTKASSQR
jgi:predicted negative regulator of RcsB-dependent stress response